MKDEIDEREIEAGEKVKRDLIDRHIEYMINYHKEGIEAYADNEDQLEFERKQLKEWEKLKKKKEERNNDRRC